jgi:hypothetical protein
VRSFLDVHAGAEHRRIGCDSSRPVGAFPGVGRLFHRRVGNCDCPINT